MKINFKETEMRIKRMKNGNERGTVYKSSQVQTFYTFLKKAEGCKIKCLFVVDIKKIYYTKKLPRGIQRKKYSPGIQFQRTEQKNG